MSVGPSENALSSSSYCFKPSYKTSSFALAGLVAIIGIAVFSQEKLEGGILTGIGGGALLLGGIALISHMFLTRSKKEEPEVQVVKKLEPEQPVTPPLPPPPTVVYESSKCFKIVRGSDVIQIIPNIFSPSGATVLRTKFVKQGYRIIKYSD